MNICIWADDIPSSSWHFSQFMGLSENRVPHGFVLSMYGGFLKWWHPQIIQVTRPC